MKVSLAAALFAAALVAFFSTPRLAAQVQAAEKMVAPHRTAPHNINIRSKSAQEAIDRQKRLAASVRQALSVPGPWTIGISSLTPSPFPQFDQATLLFQNGENQRFQPILLSKDGRYYIVGSYYDTTVNYDAQRMAEIHLENAPAKGPADAAVTIVEYSDPQCPACKQVHNIINTDKILKDYPGKVRWVSKNIPIVPSHDWAASASAACLCAAEQKPETFWQMQNYFFDKQTEMSLPVVTENALKMAQNLGLNLEQFRNCYESAQIGDRIKADMKESETVGIVMTPSFVINGRLIIGGATEQDFRALIEHFLNRKND